MIYNYGENINIQQIALENTYTHTYTHTHTYIQIDIDIY